MMLRIPVLSLCLVATAWSADAAPAPTKPDAKPATPEAKAAAPTTPKPAADAKSAAAPEAKSVTPASAPTAEGTPVEMTTLQKASYLIGTNMAGAVKEYGLDVALVLQGIDDTVSGKPALIPKEQGPEVFAKFEADIAATKAQAGAGRQASNAAWLAENAKKANVKSTASGLQYEVVASTTKKDAKKPTAADQVKVNYTGALTDGTVFDASANHGGPATFGVGQVIKGWTEALQLMSEGDKFKLYIPAELTYGENAPPSIGPNQILVFDVELVEVVGGGAPATFKP